MPKKPKEKWPKIVVFPQSFLVDADENLYSEIAVEN
jgi:hypothetical protein